MIETWTDKQVEEARLENMENDRRNEIDRKMYSTGYTKKVKKIQSDRQMDIGV